MSYKDWDVTANRYVAYLDILGFKNMVLENTHTAIYKKLQVISDYQKYILEINSKIKGASFVRVMTFSDSIFIFAKDETEEALRRFMNVVNYMLCKCIYNEIPIKGAASYGMLTVDFDNSLFFGKPLISAYELHDELLLYGVILDGALEKRIDDILLEDKDDMYTVIHEVPYKQGKALGTLLNWPYFYVKSKNYGKKKIYDALYELSYMSSGINRRYIDNTEDFVSEALKVYDSKETRTSE